MPNFDQETTAIAAILQEFGDRRYREGLEKGLEVAERVLDWLKMADGPCRAGIVEGAEKAIKEARDG